MDTDTTVDQRAPHQQVPPCPASLEQLKELGVLHFTVDADKCVSARGEGGATIFLP